MAARPGAAARAAAAREAAKVGREAAADAARRAQQGELARAEARKDLQRAEDEVERVGQRLGRLGAEVGRLNDAADEAEGQAQDAAERLADADDARDDRARALQAVEEAVEAAEAARDEAVHALHLLKTGVVARRERLDAARAALRRIERQVDEVEERTARAGTLRGEVERRLSELAEQRVDAEHALAGAKAAAAEKAGGVAALKAAHQEAAAAHQEAEEALERLRGGRERGRDALNEARLALQGERLRLENLGERVRERWHQPIDEVLAAHADAAPPTAEDRERLDALETLIERMGDVNVHAIEEFEEVSARSEFLTTQRDDLVQALDDLTQAIEQINRTSKTLFKDTFEAVNARFQVLFPRLFRGGDAELVLTDPEDLLETGIEMLVRPPGKKVQNVALLSGGEKAMCAIALVFAVFQVKPSPFCLLDEVDAPLDDANIGRFNEIVREMAQTSQILLITHNKRTMEIADVLYGITMEESGVSKLVSVRMT
ncbi:MAG: hypothetical protein H6704_08415 [Myxococcales bacterium]|nr:hypothetical protein [Myxococcales bacterium]